MPYVDVSHGRLYYETAGSGEALVFVHGAGSNVRQWDPQFEPFSAACQVVRYDLRGHGRSTLPTAEPYTHAGDLRVLLDHLGIERATLVGQSMGGEIAIEFAIATPERLRALVLVDSIVHGHEWSDEWNASWGAIMDAVASGVPGAFVPHLLEHPVLVHTAKTPEAKALLTEIFLDYTGWHWRHADTLVYAEPPALQQLDRIEAPALVILGLEDAPDLCRIADALSAGLPNVRRIDFPGVGHVPPLEVPEEFNRLLGEFLTQTSDGITA